MPKVSISEAARMAGISRQHLYKKYIHPGLLTIERDDENKPMIDSSELIRVFGGKLKVVTPSEQSSDVAEQQFLTATLDMKNKYLEAEITVLREQLTASTGRETWLQGKVDELTGQLSAAHRLLEHRPRVAPDPGQPKGFFARLFGR